MLPKCSVPHSYRVRQAPGPSVQCRDLSSKKVSAPGPAMQHWASSGQVSTGASSRPGLPSLTPLAKGCRGHTFSCAACRAARWSSDRSVCRMRHGAALTPQADACFMDFHCRRDRGQLLHCRPAVRSPWGQAVVQLLPKCSAPPHSQGVCRGSQAPPAPPPTVPGPSAQCRFSSDNVSAPGPAMQHSASSAQVSTGASSRPGLPSLTRLAKG